MRKMLVFPAAALLVAACGCSKKEAKEAEPVTPVEVAPVERTSLHRIVTADAVLYPRDQAAVTPKISAPVRAFYVNRGDVVKRGQLLAVLENRDLAAAAAAGKGQLAQAEANYRSTSGASVPEEVNRARADVRAAGQALAAAEKLLESREQLYKEGALARRPVDEARVAHAQARSQYETAEAHLRSFESIGRQEQVKSAAAQVDTARGQYQAAEAQVAYSQIHSPIDGVVADRPLYAGEMASAGIALVTVMDLSRVVARANVPQNVAALVKVGQPATIRETGGAGDVPGKVTVVSPAVDANSTTVQVWVEAANPGGRLKPGAAVQVSIVAGTLANVAAVPEAALLPAAGGGVCVMVIDSGGVARAKKVETGVRDAGKVEIVSGAAAGERVVTVGGLGLQDGARVAVCAPGAASAREQ
jgi:multidrug efflux pump subunit AcrA (membrane-fusion protein)